MRLPLKTLALGVFLMLLSAPAWAFPELVRKGYNNCVTCHVSVTGGGVLKAYGRALSKEELSHTGTEAESAFAYSLFETPENLHLGGDFRWAYLYRDTALLRQGRGFLMQADLEGALVLGRWTLSTTAGVHNSEFLSRRHFVSYELTENFSLRAGRFNKAFGINLPDHIVSVKRGLGWDFLTEDYNLEASWIDDRSTYYLTVDLGRPEKPSVQRETGVAVSAWRMVGDTHKVGASFFTGSSPRTGSRTLLGLHGILGFNSETFLLAEADLQFKGGKSGVASYLRLDRELLQGYHLFLTHEVLDLDLSRSSSMNQSFGLGAQAFPRPHLEFQLVWSKRQDLSQGTGLEDTAYFLAHFYP